MIFRAWRCVTWVDHVVIIPGCVDRWDHDEVTADLRDYVVDHLGGDGAGEDGVLIVDETGGAPRGAERSRGKRGPPLVIAVTG